MQPPSGNHTSPSTLLSPTAAPASIWAPAAWPQAVAAAATTTVATTDAAEPQPNWVLDGPYLAELASANDSLKQRPLPGGLPFHPLHPGCPLLPLCKLYGVPATAAALGAYCFQRLLSGNDELRARAVQAGFFSIADGHVCMHATPASPPLLAILCTCIHLGTQTIKGPRYDSQLASMLSHATGEPMPPDQVVELEALCLQKLRGRLGP